MGGPERPSRLPEAKYPPPPGLFGLFSADALFSSIRCQIRTLRLSKQPRCQILCCCREQGSDLIIRVGKWESEVPRVTAEAGATVVVAEEEVEYR